MFLENQEKTTQSILPVFSVKSIQEILDVEKQKVVEDCVKITQVKTKIRQIKTKIGLIKTKIVQVKTKIVQIKTKIVQIKIVQIKIKIVLEMQAQPKVRLPDFRKRITQPIVWLY